MRHCLVACLSSYLEVEPVGALRVAGGCLDVAEKLGESRGRQVVLDSDVVPLPAVVGARVQEGAVGMLAPRALQAPSQVVDAGVRWCKEEEENERRADSLAYLQLPSSSSSSSGGRGAQVERCDKRRAEVAPVGIHNRLARVSKDEANLDSENGAAWVDGRG